MGNAHPFYRFKQAWNAGFYPDNQIVSDLLNEMQGLISGFLSSWAIPGTTTIGELKYTVQNFVNNYNQSPYYGNFEVTFTTAPDPPFTDYYIYIRDNSLYQMDSSQQLIIVGQYVTSTKKISSATLTSFAPGSYTGAFASPLIAEEQKVKEALNVVYMNGSAIFPITYAFNSGTNEAVSGLARGSDWLLSGSEANRFPAPIVPYKNQRTFELPALDGDDSYIVSIMERIIQASLADSNFTNSILATANSFTLPDGWTFGVSHPSFTTYDRVQFDFVNPDRRKFILVGRQDGQWLWQRFVSDYYNNSPYDFLTAYTETTPLPYEPNQAGRWLYNEDTFDYEFVEFTSDCYTSPEFYAMPAKPGDQFQFNVVDANLTGLDAVNVGLFSEDGQFVQQIGSALIQTYTCECLPESTCTLIISYSIPESQWPQYLTDLSVFNDGPTSINFQVYKNGEIFESGGLSYVSPPSTFSTSDVFDQVSNLPGLSLALINGYYKFSYTIIDAVCGDEYYLVNNAIEADAEFPQPTVVVFSSSIFTCAITNYPNQHYASVTIPSKKGCYRMGFYSDPPTTCDLSFAVSITGASSFPDYLTSTWLLSYLSVGIWNGSEWVNVSGLQIGEGITIESIVSYFDALSGVSCVYTDSTNSIDFIWDQTVDCDAEYNIKVCITDVDYVIIEGLFQSEPQSCACGTTPYLYSLSNIINIDASDCFSTILEFWSDSNTMAEGFEYQSNWKQRVRLGINGGGEKPIIEESLYRQSNGVHRRPQNKQDLSVDLHTDFLDLDTQLALVDATRHPYLVWEGKSIFVKGDVEVATTQDFSTQTSFETLSQVKFQALIQGFQPKNSSCLTC